MRTGGEDLEDEKLSKESRLIAVFYGYHDPQLFG